MCVPVCLEGDGGLCAPGGQTSSLRRLFSSRKVWDVVGACPTCPLPFLPLGWECLSCVGATTVLQKHVTCSISQAHSRRGLCLWMNCSLSHPHWVGRPHDVDSGSAGHSRGTTRRWRRVDRDATCPPESMSRVSARLHSSKRSRSFGPMLV